MGKGNQSELAAPHVRLEQDEVGSKYPTYVAVAEGKEQQKLDKAIVEKLDPKLRVKVLSPAKALDAGYKVGKGCGGFGNLLLFRRHVDPESKIYYPLSKWRNEMRTQEALALGSFLSTTWGPTWSSRSLTPRERRPRQAAAVLASVSAIA